VKKIRRVRLAAIVVAFLTVALMMGGCTLSKKAYQDRLTKIVQQAKSDLDPIISSKAELEKKGGTNLTEITKKEIKVLKDIKNQVDSITPPDDFFAGHAELLQFLDLYIQSEENYLKAGKPSNKSKNQLLVQNQQFQLTIAANRALSEASRQLPFMQYYFQQAFGRLLSSSNPMLGFPPGQRQPLSSPGKK
jgi:hypothetical protein